MAGSEAHWMRATESIFGIQRPGQVRLRTHSAAQCAPGYCCIHRPSPHHMREWPLNWRGDRHIMERICPHGTGHPDPDDAAYRKAHPRAGYQHDSGVHGCDGCCVPPGKRGSAGSGSPADD
jgi:hypothetical protein